MRITKKDDLLKLIRFKSSNKKSLIIRGNILGNETKSKSIYFITSEDYHRLANPLLRVIRESRDYNTD
ncbi:MAG: hypothetical protein CM15mP73_2830 [Hyphomicrobiales bacterium]|nr:MAG: hypothetical protein CM15mP73_2830 [Hyphomicrobiales bacterium]